jgi:hypothetical protein
MRKLSGEALLLIMLSLPHYFLARTKGGMMVAVNLSSPFFNWFCQKSAALDVYGQKRMLIRIWIWMLYPT